VFASVQARRALAIPRAANHQRHGPIYTAAALVKAQATTSASKNLAGQLQITSTPVGDRLGGVLLSPTGAEIEQSYVRALAYSQAWTRRAAGVEIDHFLGLGPRT
jgi:hypothetical protein